MINYPSPLRDPPASRGSIRSISVPRTSLARALACVLATAVVSILPSTASAAASTATESTDLCVGLECDSPASGSYVSEAQGSVPAVADLDELRAQKGSGFYELPALVYRGDVRPRAVAYLSKPGELDRMPASVRNLTAVRNFAQAAGAKADTAALVVVDHGIGIVFPAEPVAGAARRPSARAAQLHWACPERTSCLFSLENGGGGNWQWDGARYAGAGWHNLGTNFGSSIINDRGGDTLLADHGMGDGTRYCSQQWSIDWSFANNPIGNGTASSIALLGSTPDRC